MFSSSLVISAAAGDETGTVRLKMAPYRTPASSEACGCNRPTPFGMWRRPTRGWSGPPPVAAGDRGVAGILAFGRECHKKFLASGSLVASGLETGLVFLFENRNHLSFRGAWVGCTFEHYQLTP